MGIGGVIFAIENHAASKIPTPEEKFASLQWAFNDCRTNRNQTIEDRAELVVHEDEPTLARIRAKYEARVGYDFKTKEAAIKSLDELTALANECMDHTFAQMQKLSS